MKENKVLKLIAYSLIPILFATIIISIFYEYGQKYYKEEEYFSSAEFVDEYIIDLRNNISNLIYDNAFYNSTKDRRYRNIL